MKKAGLKKFAALFLSAGIMFNTTLSSYGQIDELILTEQVQNTYSGRPEATAMIRNLNFTDVGNDFWGKEAIIKSGALGVVKGYDRTYSPNATISNEEAIALALRLIGREQEAQELSVTLLESAPPDSPLRTVWSIGYLSIAMDLGLITEEEYNAVITVNTPETPPEPDSPEPDSPEPDSPEPNFVRTDPASRESVMNWVYLALLSSSSDAFDTKATQQSLYQYSDFDSIAPDKAAAVEALTRTGIIGRNATSFRPKSNLTRAEMAQIVANLDEIYNKTQGLEKKSGTIGALQDAQYTDTTSGRLGRRFYVRLSNGTVEMLLYEQNINSSPQATILDAVVYKNGAVSGLSSLAEGDTIEYIVEPKTNQVYYVNVLDVNVARQTVAGRLVSINADDNKPAIDTPDADLIPSVPNAISITIASSDNKYYTYPVVPSAIKVIDNVRHLIISDKSIVLNEIPIGSMVELELINNVVEKLQYIGQMKVAEEIQGIVLENNPALGYIEIIDNKSNIITKRYTSGDITVEKQEYYDLQDEIGYYDEMFPSFEYDPRDTVISNIEPGDIVYIAPNPADPEYISRISAVTNYIMKYGKIRSLRTNGNISSMLIEYEDKQQAWFDVAHSIFISEDGKPVEFSDVQIGDWVRLLVNQAIIAPGSIIESVKEIAIEGSEHFISTILKGKVAIINPVQNQMTLQNVYELGKSQWGNYQDLRQVSLASNSIEYYYNDQRISLDYANQFLRRSDGDVYVALENSFSGEQVKKVTFRNERDALLSPDTVTGSDGSGQFSIVASSNPIFTDQGTIVRRYGRLVDGNAISTPDYAIVALNGGNKAAIVDITDAPDTSAITIARARILSVNEGASFKVQSLSFFTGNTWSYTPIQREFSIDHETLFINDTGYVSRDSFMDFGETTAYNKVYNIVIDGTRAVQVIEAPYVQNHIRGTIYQLDGVTVAIKDATYYDKDTGKWKVLSVSNNFAMVNLHPNTIIAKQNSLIDGNGLQIGDQIKASFVNLPASVAGGMTVDSYVVQVEK